MLTVGDVCRDCVSVDTLTRARDLPVLVDDTPAVDMLVQAVDCT